MHSQGEENVINVDRRDELDWMAGQSTVRQARTALDALQSTAAQLEANVNARLAWEGLMLNLPRLQMPPQRQKGGQGHSPWTSQQEAAARKAHDG